MKFETKLIHAGNTTDPQTGAVNIPIYQSSTYKQATFGEHQGYEYSRTHNPTRDALERLVAALENGTEGFAFASGLAAITTALSLFKSGDHLVISDNLYGGTFRLLEHVFKQFEITHTAVNTSDIHAVEAAITSHTVALFIESPTNPLLSISDIKALSQLGKQHNILTLVDNTFMSPYLQQPLDLGADIVIHSATKYLGGHSDIIAGILVVKRDDIALKLRFLQNAIGAILSPNDSFLLIRGIKTLALRMDRHLENTAAILNYLASSPYVKRVYHPSFENHTNHDIFIQQTKGSVPIISFELIETIELKKLGYSLEYITVGESLGGVESLISHPATMTHASYPKETREAIGITDTLVRLSVGIEHKDDLINDLDTALKAANHGSN